MKRIWSDALSLVLFAGLAVAARGAHAQTGAAEPANAAAEPANAPTAAGEVANEVANADLPDAPAPELRHNGSADADAPAPVAVSAAQVERMPVERETTWRSFLPDFMHDQKDIWLSPAQLAEGRARAWVPTLVVAGGTAGLIVADPHVMPYFRSHQANLDDLNDVFDQGITIGEIIAVPVGVLTAGYIRHDPYEKSTALLAARAYGDSEVLEFMAKLVTRRERPSDVLAGQSFNHTFFKSAPVSLDGSSFPSGHAAGAFCVATVLSERYKNHHWVPWVMYSFATAISLSRITTLGHFPSDVFMGAAMGYGVSHFEVLRRPKY